MAARATKTAVVVNHGGAAVDSLSANFDLVTSAGVPVPADMTPPASPATPVGTTSIMSYSSNSSDSRISSAADTRDCSKLAVVIMQSGSEDFLHPAADALKDRNKCDEDEVMMKLDTNVERNNSIDMRDNNAEEEEARVGEVVEVMDSRDKKKGPLMSSPVSPLSPSSLLFTRTSLVPIGGDASGTLDVSSSGAADFEPEPSELTVGPREDVEVSASATVVAEFNADLAEVIEELLSAVEVYT